MRIIPIAFIASALLVTSCNNSGTTQTTTTDSTTSAAATTAKEPVKSKLSEEGTKMAMGVVTDYYVLKNAMVAANAGDAAKAATQLAASATNLQTYLQKDSSVGIAALKPYTDTIIAQSKLTATLTDPTCEKQRAAFGPISSSLYSVLKTVEVKNSGIYHEYCPMAFNDKGATWLSAESEIKNPYFGKKMMECGEVTDSL